MPLSAVYTRLGYNQEMVQRPVRRETAGLALLRGTLVAFTLLKNNNDISRVIKEL